MADVSKTPKKSYIGWKRKTALVPGTPWVLLKHKISFSKILNLHFAGARGREHWPGCEKELTVLFHQCFGICRVCRWLSGQPDVGISRSWLAWILPQRRILDLHSLDISTLSSTGALWHRRHFRSPAEELQIQRVRRLSPKSKGIHLCALYGSLTLLQAQACIFPMPTKPDKVHWIWCWKLRDTNFPILRFLPPCHSLKFFSVISRRWPHWEQLLVEVLIC